MFDFSGLANQLSGWVDKNPNQFWTMMDMAGQAFDPNNPAAGVGTEISRGKMMKEGQQAAEQQQIAKDAEYKQMLLDMMGGRMTAPGVKGGSTMTNKIGADGTGTTTFNYNTKDINEVSPTQPAQPAQQPSAYNLMGAYGNPFLPRR